MFSSIGEPTSHFISIPNSSEEYLYNRDTSDYEQGVEVQKNKRKKLIMRLINKYELEVSLRLTPTINEVAI